MHATEVDTHSATDLEDLLLDMRLFAGLSVMDRQAVLRCCNQRLIEPGEYLIWQGEPCDAFFIVSKGAFKLVRRTRGAVNRVIGFVGDHGVIGEEALLSGQGHQHSAVALRYSEIFGIRALPFARLIRRHPRLAWNMMVGLSRRTGQLLNHIEHLATMSAEQRVVAYLLDNYDSDRPERAVVHEYQRQCDLASMLAIAPETLCRIMTKLRRSGCVDACREGISITDADRLAALLA